MGMKVYQVGDTVEIIKDANPTIIIQQQFCAVRIVADDVTVYSFLDGTITEFDTVANIQDVGGSPIGNLQDVVQYLSKFIFSGSTTSNPIPTSGGGGTGEANTGSNVGVGDGVFKQKTGVDLEFKTLIGGAGVTITNNANDLTIDATSISGHQPIIDLTSTDTSTTIIQATPTVLSWVVERAKDSGLTHDNITNNSRIIVDDDGTYQILGNIRMFSTAQRCQFVARVLIDGAIQAQPYGSGYIRNAGTSSDYWSCLVTPPPIKLTAGQYVEIQIQVESQTTTAITGTFQGDESSFSIINLTGEKGDTGAQGVAGAVNTASNVGTGDGVFKQLTISDLEFKTLIGGTNTTITNNTNDLTIDVTGTGLNVLETATLDGNIITPPQLLADQDDYNPTGFSTCNMIRQDINGDRVITGFVAPAAGVNRIFAITNLSTSDNIKFKNNDSGSSAANRLLLRDNGPDKSIKENETAVFWYDHISSRYRPYNRIG